MPTDRPRLTPKIRELVATDRMSRPPVGRLTSRHVTALTTIARDPTGYDEPVSAPRAVTALAAGARPDDAVPVLSDVLADRKAAPEVRIAAARGLARVATSDATAALTRRLRERDPRIRQAVIAGLGQVGGPAELAQVRKLPAPADETSRRQLTFTSALIAHRHGLDGPFLPEVATPTAADLPDQGRTQLSISLQSQRTTAADRERLVGSTWGITAADRGYGVACGGGRFTLFVNRDIGTSVTSAEQLFERPLILGVLGRWYPVGVRVTPKLLVLTRPQGDGARVEVARTDGRVDYVGKATRRGTGVAFRVVNAERAGAAPTLVEGHLTGRGVSLEVAFSSARVGTPETAPAVP